MPTIGSNVFCCLLILSISGCGQPGMLTQTGLSAGEMTGLRAGADHEQGSETRPESKPATTRHIVREGNLAWKTNDRVQTVRHLQTIAKQFDGHLTRELEVRHSHRIEHQLTIRVPSKHFETVVNDISASVAHFDVRELSSRDVTTQFVDLDARLRAKIETEARCRELLSKANKIEEMLTVEEQLGRLRAEIEAMQGRMNALSDAIQLSTLNIRIFEPVSSSSNFTSRVADKVELGWLVCAELLVALAAIWPLITIALLSVLAWSRKRRNRLAPSAA